MLHFFYCVYIVTFSLTLRNYCSHHFCRSIKWWVWRLVVTSSYQSRSNISMYGLICSWRFWLDTIIFINFHVLHVLPKVDNKYKTKLHMLHSVVTWSTPEAKTCIARLHMLPFICNTCYTDCNIFLDNTGCYTCYTCYIE